MFEQFDFDTLGKVSNTAIRNQARAMLFTEIVEFLRERFGDEFVSIVDGDEVSVCVGSRTVHGFSEEVVVNANMIAKEFDTHSTASGKEVLAYDRLQEAEDYAKELKEKQEKAREIAEKKAKR